uniref:caspase-1-like n=1 Tax=Styela clava TaxID=7725 RepID=UPI001939FFA2
MNRRKQTDERDDNSCSRLFSNIISGFRGFISRPLTDGAPEDPTIHIDTSRTGQDGYTFEAENNKGPEIAKVDKEFENKQIAINTDRERRLAAMRKRLAREVDAKCSNNNTEDNNHEVLPKKLYLCMETKYVGLCIIINNNTKYSRAAGYLHEFFSAEGYEVKFHQYLKKKEIESIFDSAKSKNFNDHGCFVCFVLSTGNHRLIKTADNSSISMDKIVGYFHPKNSPTLDGKPKVFFFQNGIDIVNARNLWNDDERTPFPTYVDAVVVRSTLRDFIDRFITILAAHPRESLSTIMTLLQSETLLSFTCNEQYQVIRDMTKEVYFTIEKSTAGTSNPQTTAHIHAPTEKKLNAMMKGPSSDNSNTTPDVDAHMQEEGSSDRTKPKE